MGRTIDPAARKRESALLLGLLLDLGIIIPYLAIALWSNSLTLLGEVIRGGLLMLLEAYLYFLIRRIHRGRLVGYEYGTGSLEQFGNLAVGLAMIGAALWMVASIAMRWAEPETGTQDSLVVGSAMALINLALNAYALRSVWQAGRDGTSIIVSGQIRSRLSKTISSLVVVAVIVVNALYAGATVGHVADLAGAAFIVCVMVSLGMALCRSALPSLVDQSLSEALQVSINQILARRYDEFDSLTRVRSRQAGGGALVEVHLGFDADRTMRDVQRTCSGMDADLRQLIPGAEIVIVPHAVDVVGLSDAA